MSHSRWVWTGVCLLQLLGLTNVLSRVALVNMLQTSSATHLGQTFVQFRQPIHVYSSTNTCAAQHSTARHSMAQVTTITRAAAGMYNHNWEKHCCPTVPAACTQALLP